MLTTAQRNELHRADNAKAIRVAIYEVGMWGAAVFVAAKVAELWPNYEWFPLAMAVAMVVNLGVTRHRDWKAMEFLEEQLDRDEDEQD